MSHAPLTTYHSDGLHFSAGKGGCQPGKPARMPKPGGIQASGPFGFEKNSSCSCWIEQLGKPLLSGLCRQEFKCSSGPLKTWGESRSLLGVHGGRAVNMLSTVGDAHIRFQPQDSGEPNLILKVSGGFGIQYG